MFFFTWPNPTDIISEKIQKKLELCAFLKWLEYAVLEAVLATNHNFTWFLIGILP